MYIIQQLLCKYFWLFLNDIDMCGYIQKWLIRMIFSNLSYFCRCWGGKRRLVEPFGLNVCDCSVSLNHGNGVHFFGFGPGRHRRDGVRAGRSGSDLGPIPGPRSPAVPWSRSWTRSPWPSSGPSISSWTVSGIGSGSPSAALRLFQRFLAFLRSSAKKM